MPSKEYILSITSKGANARYKLRYKDGKFNRLEHLSGRLANQSQHEALMKLCPPLENVILLLEMEYKDRGIVWEKVEKSQSTHEQFMDVYCSWYNDLFKLDPIIKPMDAAALKFIRTAIVKLSDTDEQAVTVWQTILSNWSKLDKWYQSQTELPQIKRNLNVILKTLKNGKSTEQAGRNAKNVSDDYRQKF